MAFWKKKKKVEEKPPVVEERVVEKPEVYVGEVIVEVLEREEGTISDSGIELKKSERVLRVTNNSSIPVFSTELVLGNADKVSLDERLFIQSLSEHGKENSVYEVKYDVLEYKPPVVFSYELSGPTDRGGVLWYDTENIVGLLLRIKVTGEGKIGEIVVEYLPTEDISEIIPKEKSAGDISTYSDRAVWTITECEPGSEYTCLMDLKVIPRTKDKVGFGKVIIKVTTEDATFSTLFVERATSRFLMNYGVNRREKTEQPGVWDVTVDIKNPYGLELQAEGEIEFVGGDIESVPDMDFIRRENGKIVLRDAKIDPNGILSIGPVTVRSMEMPKLKIRVGGSVEERVILQSEGVYEAKLPELGVLSFGIEKKVDVVVEERMRRYVGERELPTLGDNYVEVTTRIMNDGGTDIGFVEIVDPIPRGLSSPEKISVRIDGKTIRNYEKQIVESEEQQFAKQLLVRVSGEKALPTGKSLELRYRLSMEKIESDVLEMEFPLRVMCGATPEGEKLKRSLPLDMTPTIKVVHIVRSVNVSKSVVPVEKDTFELRIDIENTGEFPIFDYEVKHVVPKDFEILNIDPEAAREETDIGTVVLWKLDLEPHESKQLVIKVRGVGKYLIDELMQAEAI